ncbi:hypothetical protein PAPYR_10671 [Paratrimastix pyriformis]|uniref:CCHC-type domain-containing protein n=1 Tax=Paratrimastix pyriformis TaxID=342808 RepID=A0ABQ8U5F9_9EUKA|nr:hypothetical protein PAPYR_10671 [Paratrimastix pyriformis]
MITDFALLAKLALERRLKGEHNAPPIHVPAAPSAGPVIPSADSDSGPSQTTANEPPKRSDSTPDLQSTLNILKQQIDQINAKLHDSDSTASAFGTTRSRETLLAERQTLQAKYDSLSGVVAKPPPRSQPPPPSPPPRTSAPMVVKKVILPVKEHPEINYVAILQGVAHSNWHRIEELCKGCRLEIHDKPAPVAGTKKPRNSPPASLEPAEPGRKESGEKASAPTTAHPEKGARRPRLDLAAPIAAPKESEKGADGELAGDQSPDADPLALGRLTGLKHERTATAERDDKDGAEVVPDEAEGPEAEASKDEETALWVEIRGADEEKTASAEQIIIQEIAAATSQERWAVERRGRQLRQLSFLTGALKVVAADGTLADPAGHKAQREAARCFICGQRGHKPAECPLAAGGAADPALVLAASSPVDAPAPPQPGPATPPNATGGASGVTTDDADALQRFLAESGIPTEAPASADLASKTVDAKGPAHDGAHDPLASAPPKEAASVEVGGILAELARKRAALAGQKALADRKADEGVSRPESLETPLSFDRFPDRERWQRPPPSLRPSGYAPMGGGCYGAGPAQMGPTGPGWARGGVPPFRGVPPPPPPTQRLYSSLFFVDPVICELRLVGMLTALRGTVLGVVPKQEISGQWRSSSHFHPASTPASSPSSLFSCS